MWKLRFIGVAVVCLVALSVAAAALAAQGGDSNAGDVWVDNVGTPAGPGHEQDPHLACQNLNLWGSGMADSSGTFTIDGWPPSGSQEQDYSGAWSYDSSQGGDQVLAVIDVSQLISTAQANGDAPISSQGYHFKLQFSQDPQKQKTFWVDCPSSTSTTSSGTGTTPATGSTTTNTAATSTPPGSAPSSATPKSSVKGVKAERQKRRHRNARRHRTLSRHARKFAGFTG